VDAHEIFGDRIGSSLANIFPDEPGERLVQRLLANDLPQRVERRATLAVVDVAVGLVIDTPDYAAS
jgi:hypothetical protein